MRQAFDAEAVSFGESDGANHGGANDGGASAGETGHDGLVDTMGVTLWAMLSQALFTDVQRACRAAVQRVAVYYALAGREVSSTNTGAYSRARAKEARGEWNGGSRALRLSAPSLARPLVSEKSDRRTPDFANS